ncbi:MAG TPA: PQQ-binding-like beta-propeller repeat protein [Blastocatellia bacterium]|nr:PQQ-binding-like beta-propeller repeat protein [Blastocatellia bacterium]
MTNTPFGFAPGKLPRIVPMLCALVLSNLIHSAYAQDWSQWRGPNRDGVVRDFTAPAVWPDKLKLAWKTPVGAGYSSPVVFKDRVWIHSRRGEEEVVSCLDLKTGKILWSKSYPVSFTKNQYAVEMGKGPHSTPVLFNSRLYTLGVTAVLSCFDAQTGELKWRKDFGQPDTSKLFTGTSMSPVIDRGNVIVHVGDDRGGSMIAFDAATGREKWKWTGDGPGYASPIVIELAGARQVVTMTDKSVIGVAAQTGELLWRLPWPDEWNENIVTPTVCKNLLILSGVRKGTMAVQVAKNGDKWETKQVWHNPEIAMYMNSPVADGDHLYGLSAKRKGQFFCLEAATGKILWATTGREGFNASLLNAGSFLFILTNDASLIVAGKSQQGFEQVAKYSVADRPTFAHPVVTGGRILIRDDAAIALWTLE